MEQAPVPEDPAIVYGRAVATAVALAHQRRAANWAAAAQGKVLTESHRPAGLPRADRNPEVWARAVAYAADKARERRARNWAGREPQQLDFPEPIAPGPDDLLDKLSHIT